MTTTGTILGEAPHRRCAELDGSAAHPVGTAPVGIWP